MPSFGMNISKYNLLTATDETLGQIREELSANIRQYIPDLQNTTVQVAVYDNEEDPTDKTKYLGISINGVSGHDMLNTNFLIYENVQKETIVLNESF